MRTRRRVCGVVLIDLFTLALGFGRMALPLLLVLHPASWPRAVADHLAGVWGRRYVASDGFPTRRVAEE